MAYGVPLVMNFALAIPYIFIEVLIVGAAYFLTVIDILPRLAGVMAPAGVPVIISGFKFSNLNPIKYAITTNNSPDKDSNIK